MIAIKFAEWILQSGYQPVGIYDKEMRWGEAKVGGELYTTIQLYSIFLEHELAGEDTGDKSQ